MGFQSGDDISSREWMPNAESFLGGGSGPIENIMPPTVPEHEHPSHSFMLSLPSGEQLKRNELDSAIKESAFCRANVSMKSCCEDPPLGDDDQQTTTELSGMDDTISQGCMQLEHTNDMLPQKLGTKQRTRDRMVDELERLASADSWKVKTEDGTFDELKDVWETQRELLLEHLEQKDNLIQKQSGMLASNAKALRQLSVAVDGLEMRFSHELNSRKWKLDQTQQTAQKEVDSIKLSASKIEREQTRWINLLKNTTSASAAYSAQKDLSFDDAFQKECIICQHSLIEKQAITEKLDSANAEIESLNCEVSKLTEHLAAVKTENQQLREQIESLRAVCTDKGSASDLSLGEEEHCRVRVCASKEDKNSVEAIKRENYQLKRDIIDMRERLVDLKEHSDSLESQVRQQQEAFQQSCSQIHEFEALKTRKQELESLLSQKQKSINGLKQSLSRLQSELDREGSEPSSREDAFLNEVLAAQQRCEDMESVLMNVRTERDDCMRENHRLVIELRSLDHETKKQMRLCERLRREQADLKKTVNCQKSEIQTLQTYVRVESLKTASHSKRKTRSGSGSDCDVMRELLKTKVDLAEMNELVIRLRHEISSIKNKTTYKTRHGYQLIRKVLTSTLTR